MADLDRDAILRVLLDNGVDFVIIGASAAILQGVPIAATLDLDVAASRTKANLGRLATALKEMGATLRVPETEEGVAAPLDGRMLANVSVITLVTRYGPLDVFFSPDGVSDYPELKKRAVEVAPFKLAIRVASLEDLVAMKMAAGREKDAAHLTVLLEHLRR